MTAFAPRPPGSAIASDIVCGHADARHHRPVRRLALVDCSSARPARTASAPPSSSATRRSCAVALGRPTQRGDADMLTTVADVAARSLGPGDARVAVARAARRSHRPRPARGAPRSAACSPSATTRRSTASRGSRRACSTHRSRSCRSSTRDRQVFASCIGLDDDVAEAGGTPLSQSFCQHAVAAREPLVVGDARRAPGPPDQRRDRGARDHRLRRRPAHRPRRPRPRHPLRRRRPPAHPGPPSDVEVLTDLAASVLTEIKLRRK